MGAAIFSAIIGLITSVVSAGIAYNASKKTNENTNATNTENVKATNESNQAINQANIDYNTAMTQAAWERDDTAHQREVADLQAAGLSPLAATGGLNVTSPLGAPNPIAMQAPQVDSNSLINAFLNASNQIGNSSSKFSQLAEDIRSHKSSEKLRADEILNDAKELSLKAESISLDNKKLEEEIRYQTKLNELAAQENYEFARHNKENEKLEKQRIESQELNERIKIIYEELKTKSNNQPYVLCTSPQEYTAKVTARLNAINRYLEKHGTTRTGQGSSSGAGASANGAVAGFPIGGSINGQKSGHTYNDYSKQMEADWDKLIMQYPFPIPDYDYYYTKQLKKFKEYKD